MSLRSFTRSTRVRAVLAAAGMTAFVLSLACRDLKTARPLGQLREMQQMVAGRLDADFVGNSACLAACHYHDKLARFFEATTMGEVMATEQGVALIDCESCHGPGGLAILGLTPESVRADSARGIQTACNHDTLIDLAKLPVTAQDLVCVNCHSTLASFNLHDYPDSPHARAEVPCIKCHPPHAGPYLIIGFREQSRQCAACHEDKYAEMALPSHHPIRENKMVCNDCHDPHSAFEHGLVKATVEETCLSCHAEKMGPFAFEHADAVRACTECHQPHGSVNDHLLRQSDPMVCLRCHSGHWLATASGPTTPQMKGAFYTRCTDCHTSIHGTDAPSPTGRGTFLR